jgi:hypothetical protein
MANVFVSHRGPDLDGAERLAECIRAAGHNVWLDVWKISAIEEPPMLEGKAA